MTTFVLVPGAWLGGWVWRDVAPRLRAAGHDVFTPTLTGLGERRHLAHPDVDLDTHVEDVLNVLELEGLHQVVLLGHSYAGMVITGVADRAPERLAHLVYLDAMVPQDGQSAFSEDPPQFRALVEEQARLKGDGWRWPLPDLEELRQYFNLDGIGEANERWLLTKSVAHPIKTFAQPLRLTNAAADAIPRTYIRCAADSDGPLPDDVEHARSDPGWGYHELVTGHWPMLSRPDELAALLLEIVRTSSGGDA